MSWNFEIAKKHTSRFIIKHILISIVTLSAITSRIRTGWAPIRTITALIRPGLILSRRTLSQAILTVLWQDSASWNQSAFSSRGIYCISVIFCKAIRNTVINRGGCIFVAWCIGCLYSRTIFDASRSIAFYHAFKLNFKKIK